MSIRSRANLLVALAAVALTGLTLTACGAESNADSTTASSPSAIAATSSSGSGEGQSGAQGSVDEAKALVAGFTAEQTSIGITTPVSGTIPTGKRVDFMMCGAPACQSFVEPIQAAADVLGWEVKIVTAGPTPDKTAEGWNLAVQDKPDAVISSAFPQATWSGQLAELQEAGIPVVECCVTDEPGNGIIFVDTGKETAVASGKMQAAWVVAATDGNANTLYLNVPAYPILASELQGFNEEYDRLCQGCTRDSLDLNVADIGTSAMTTSIIGYLQSHPDVNYLAAGSDDVLVGLPAALSAAGLSDRVKAVGLSPSTVNLNYIVQDQAQVATVSFPHAEIAWKMMDVLARHFAGDSLDPDEPMLPRRLLTADNIADPNALTPTVADYQEQFKKLWNK